MKKNVIFFFFFMTVMLPYMCFRSPGLSAPGCSRASGRAVACVEICDFQTPLSEFGGNPQRSRDPNRKGQR